MAPANCGGLGRDGMTTTAASCQWIDLHNGKQFSRLLYTNPVCFLATSKASVKKDRNSIDSQSHVIARESDQQPMCASTDGTASSNFGLKRKQAEVSPAERNVMVLTWITPTNNEGRFMFSINKSRYSALLLLETMWFTLSVPVHGMEELIRNVGSVSGRFGSKFPIDHFDPHLPNGTKDGNQHPERHDTALSTRQRKKIPRFIRGIPGLTIHEAPIIHEEGLTSSIPPPPLFVVDGTVAHIICRAYRIMGAPRVDRKEEEASRCEKRTSVGCRIDDLHMFDDCIDQDHFLVLAQVIQARVSAQYWDAKLNLFCPQSAINPPYLTFLGSQTFGRVVMNSSSRQDEILDQNNDEP